MASLSRRVSVSSSGSAPSKASLQLLQAAREGNASDVESLLYQLSEETSSVDINAQGEGQMTPLLLAAEGNHQRVLKRLLMSESINVNAQDELGRTAIIIAAQRGLASVAQILLDAGANFLLCAQGGYTSLHMAALHGHIGFVNLLVGVSEPQDFGYSELASPLEKYRKVFKGVNNNRSHNSIKDFSSSQQMNCKLFRRSGTPDQGGAGSPLCGRPFTPFGSATTPECGGNGDVGPPGETLTFQPSKTDVLRLLEAKTSAELLIPLHLAAANGHCQVVASLIQAYGQAVGITEVLATVQEKGGKEALNLVTTSIIRILNSHGDMYSSDDVKADVLDRALGTLLPQGYDLSSLSWSSIDAMVSYVNQKDCIGRTPLHHATWEQHVGVVATLLEVFIVNLNSTDMDGFTPLHLSSWKGVQTVMELLIAHDSKFHMLNPNMPARHNKSTRAKIVEVKRVQQKLGSIPFVLNMHDFICPEERDGMTALHYAVEGDNEAIVAALTGLSNIDVFAEASPVTQPSSVMEALAPDGEETTETPLTMAFSRNDSIFLLKLLKSGKRNKIMQDIQLLRSYFSKSFNFEENRKIVKQYHRKLLKTTVRIIKSDQEILKGDLFPNLERELGVVLNTILHKPNSNKFTLLQHAAFAGLSLELDILLSIPEIASDINTGDIDNQTPLHFATMEGETGAVKVLVKNTALRPNEEDRNDRSPLQIASEKGSRDIVSLLMNCPDVKMEMERLYRDRGVNDNAANAILVVAALIASVSFAGWLQPPLGLRNYYDLKPSAGEPPGTIDSFAAVQQYQSVLVFWIFNSLSFYLAMGTVISGAAEVLPMRDAFIGQEVRMVRGGLVRTSMLLVMSIVCVLIAFGAAGFASLPPIHKYQSMMRWTTIWGAGICCSMLLIYFSRMGSMFVTESSYQKVKWLRWNKEDYINAIPVTRVLWKVLKVFNLVPENYTRFESKRQEEKESYKRKMFWQLIKLFKMDREEYWRYHVN